MYVGTADAVVLASQISELIEENKIEEVLSLLQGLNSLQALYVAYACANEGRNLLFPQMVTAIAKTMNKGES